MRIPALLGLTLPFTAWAGRSAVVQLPDDATPILAYEGLDDAEQAAVYLVFERGIPVPLELPGPTHLSAEVSPWSPDGEHLLVARDEGLVRVSMSTGQATPLRAPAGMLDPQGWFPDSRALVTCAADEPDCALVPLEGEALKIPGVVWSSWTHDEAGWGWNVVSSGGTPLQLQRQRYRSSTEVSTLDELLPPRDHQVVQARPGSDRKLMVVMPGGVDPQMALSRSKSDFSTVPRPDAVEVRSYGWSPDGTQLAWVMADAASGAEPTRGWLGLTSPGSETVDPLAEDVASAWWYPGGDTPTHHIPVLVAGPGASGAGVWFGERLVDLGRIRQWEISEHGLTVVLDKPGDALFGRLDPETGELLWRSVPPGQVIDIVVAPEGRTFALTLRNGIFEVSEHGPVERLPFDPDWHVRALELSADGAVLLGRKSSGRGYSHSSTYRAWSTTTWDELGAQPLSSSAMVPLPEGDFLVDSQNVYARWTPGEQPQWLPYATQPLPPGVEPTSADGEAVQRGSGLGGTRYFRQGTLPKASGGSYTAPRPQITVAPDDASLWVLRSGEATRVALDGGEVLETRTGEDVAIRHALLSPDGRFSAHRTGELVQIWEAESGRQVAEAPLRTRSLAWTTDGRSLLCHTHEGQDLLIWDVSSLYEGRAPAPLHLPGK